MKNSINSFFFFLLFTTISVSCLAQEYLMDLHHYGIEDGISHGQVLSVHKDNSGMMWVLAKDKINRFDGLHFSAIDHQRLFYMYANIIGEDASGDLWIRSAYEKGDIVFFNTQTEQFKSFAEKFEGTVLGDHFAKEGKDPNMEFYYTSINGDYFFGTKEGALIRFDPKEETIVTTSFDKGNRVLPFFETSEGLIWVNVIRKKVNYRGHGDLVALDKKGQVIHKIELDDIAINFNQIGDKEFSFSTFDNFYTVDEFGVTKKYPLSKFSQRPVSGDGSNLFHYIRYDSKYDQHWMINEFRELLVFHPEKGLLENFSLRYGEDGLKDYHDMFLDDNGVAWMATIDGLFQMSCSPNKFQQYFVDDSKKQQTGKVSCRGITSNSEGVVFANTLQGVFSLENKTTTQVAPFIDHFFHPGLIDKQGHFWTASSDVLTELRGNKTIESWELDAGMIWALFESKNRIWITGEKENVTLQYLDLSTRTLHAFDQYNGYEALRKSTIYSIQKTNEGALWLITDKGIFVLDEQTGIQARYWSGGKGEFHLPADNLKHMHQDKEGVVWLASTQGLIRWDRTNETSRQFTIKDGLPHNNLYAVYEDDFGFLWLSSDNGIGQFQKSSERVKVYLPSDGIAHHEFNRISHHQISGSKNLKQNGMIYFGGLNGITAFHPKNFSTQFEDQPDIPLTLLSCSIFSNKTGKEENIKDDFFANKKIVVHPGDQSLSIEFALLEYENPQLVQYECLIEGYNKKWTRLKSNSLLLSGLPYGEFEINVRAKTGNGVYSMQKLAISIDVLRPFYLQWWFAVLSICVLIGGIFLVYHWRTNELRRQKLLLEKEVLERTKTITGQAKELKSMDEVKTRFFANISHELRTPLTLILVPLKTLLKRNKLDSEQTQLISTAHQNAQNLLKLTNEILDLTKLEAYKMELIESPVFILEETRRIFSFFETQAYQEGVDFQFVNEINPDLQVQLDKGKFEKILMNLISNALKFTSKGGEVILKIENGGSDIKVMVKDSGKGISEVDLPHVFERFYQSKEKDATGEGGTGIGLALCKELSKLFNGKIWAESTLGKGSTFIFQFPKKEVITYTLPEEYPAELNETNAIPELIKEFNASEQKKVSTVSEKPSILVVEDNADLRAFLKLILQKKYDILSAENGKVGLDILQKHHSDKQSRPIQMILSDVMMPVMDGFQFLEKIKSEPDFASIPVVMLTARAGLYNKLKALRIGVDDYILKPFEEEELLIRIQNILKNVASRKVYQKEVVVQLDVAGSVEEEDKELNQVDQIWLSEIEQKVLDEISNFNFNAEMLAQKIFLSRRQLDRRLKVMTGLTTGEYIREAKLQEARILIESRKFQTIKEISFQVGIKSAAYFSKQFKIRFGKSPADLLK